MPINVYIDESGSFVSASKPGSWNAVAAFAVPEIARKGLEAAVARIKMLMGRTGSKEVKLNDVNESSYFSFLAQLRTLNGTLFCVATDAGFNTTETVAQHQKEQVGKIVHHIDKMIYNSGRQAVAFLASQVEKLSPQLYVQLFCQVSLMHDVVSRAITYYAQHNPATLSEFRWRIDCKGDLARNS